MRSRNQHLRLRKVFHHKNSHLTHVSSDSPNLPKSRKYKTLEKKGKHSSLFGKRLRCLLCYHCDNFVVCYPNCGNRKHAYHQSCFLKAYKYHQRCPHCITPITGYEILGYNILLPRRESEEQQEEEEVVEVVEVVVGNPFEQQNIIENNLNDGFLSLFESGGKGDDIVQQVLSQTH